MRLLRALGRLAAAAAVLVVARRWAPGRRPPADPAPARAELAVAGLLLAAGAAGVAFVVVYALGADTQLLGLALGGACALLAAALALASRSLVPQEEAREERGELVRAEDEREVEELVAAAGERLTRRKLLAGAAGAAGLGLAAAIVVPAASLGPALDTDRLLRSPWRAGRRLVDERGRPLRTEDVELGAFRVAFPEGVPRATLDAPLVVVRIPVEMLRLPGERAGWAPDGVVAFSQICPHAGCAITLYRWPRFEPTAPGPALVCPCHYSTFDPTTGGELLFGPAGRALPQLPLAVGPDGVLAAAGGFSGAVGPSWWGVRRA